MAMACESGADIWRVDSVKAYFGVVTGVELAEGCYKGGCSGV